MYIWTKASTPGPMNQVADFDREGLPTAVICAQPHSQSLLFWNANIEVVKVGRTQSRPQTPPSHREKRSGEPS